MTSRNVEEELVSLSFTPISKFITTANGQEMAKYIKSFTPTGEIVYIHLDAEGAVCTDGTCEQIITDTPADTKVPVTLRNIVLENNRLDLAGVIFECSDSICAYHRKQDNPLEFDEKIFSRGSVGSVRFDITPMSYPVIKLSDLRSNYRATLKSASDSFRQMRNIMYDRCIGNINSQHLLINSYIENVQTYFQRSEDISRNLITSVQTLETFALNYESKGRLSPEEKQKYQLVLYNLQKRSLLAEEFIRLCNSFIETKDTLTQLIENIENINTRYDDFTSLNNVYM